MDNDNHNTAADKGRVYASTDKTHFPIISSNVDSCERNGIGSLCSSIEQNRSTFWVIVKFNNQHNSIKHNLPKSE